MVHGVLAFCGIFILVFAQPSTGLQDYMPGTNPYSQSNTSSSSSTGDDWVKLLPTFGDGWIHPTISLLCNNNNWELYDMNSNETTALSSPPSNLKPYSVKIWHCSNFILDNITTSREAATNVDGLHLANFLAFNNVTNGTIRNSIIETDLIFYITASRSIYFNETYFPNPFVVDPEKQWRIWVLISADVLFFRSELTANIRHEIGGDLDFKFLDCIIHRMAISDTVEVKKEVNMNEPKDRYSDTSTELGSRKWLDFGGLDLDPFGHCGAEDEFISSELRANFSFYMLFESCEFQLELQDSNDGIILQHVSGNLHMHFRDTTFRDKWYKDKKSFDHPDHSTFMVPIIDLSFREGTIVFERIQIFTTKQRGHEIADLISVTQAPCVDGCVDGSLFPCVDAHFLNDTYVIFEDIDLIIAHNGNLMNFQNSMGNLIVRDMTIHIHISTDGEDIIFPDSMFTVVANSSLFENVMIAEWDAINAPHKLFEMILEVGTHDFHNIYSFRNLSFYNYSVQVDDLNVLIHIGSSAKGETEGIITIEDIYVDSSFIRCQTFVGHNDMHSFLIRGLYGNFGKVFVRNVALVNIIDVRPYALNPARIEEEYEVSISIDDAEDILVKDIFFVNLTSTASSPHLKLSSYGNAIIENMICSNCSNTLGAATCIYMSGIRSFTRILHSTMYLTSSPIAGAIFMEGGNTRIENTLFEENLGNTASILTMVGSNARVSFKDCVITQSASFDKFPPYVRSRFSLINAYEGTMTMHDTSINTAVAVVVGGDLEIDFRNVIITSRHDTVFTVKSGKIDNKTTILCSNTDYPAACFTTDFIPWEYKCFQCPLEEYSLGEPLFSSNSLTNNVCTKCPEIGTSQCGGNVIIARAGYNLIPNMRNINTGCGHNETKSYEVYDIHRCAPGFCIEGECNTRRTGSLCTECEDRYSVQFGSNECIHEDECGWLMVPLILLFWICFGIFVLKNHTSSRSRLSIAMKSLILFFQMLPIYTPENLDPMSSILSSFSRGDSTRISSGTSFGFCLFHMKQADSIILGGVNILMCALSVFIFSFIWPPDSKRFLAIDVFILLIVSVVDIFGTSLLCTEISKGSNPPKYFMVYDTTVQCVQWWQIILLVIYCLIILFFCYAIRVVKRAIQDRTSSQHIDLSLYVTYIYRKEIWFWEGALFFFRFISGNISTAAYNDSFWRASCLTFMAVIFAIMTAWLRPYHKSMGMLNAFESYLFFILFLYGVMSISESFHTKTDFPGKEDLRFFQIVVTIFTYATSVIFLMLLFFCTDRSLEMSLERRQKQLTDIATKEVQFQIELEMTSFKNRQMVPEAVNIEHFSLAGGFVQSNEQADDSNIFFI